jgi:hypothetical protein
MSIAFPMEAQCIVERGKQLPLDMADNQVYCINFA